MNAARQQIEQPMLTPSIAASEAVNMSIIRDWKPLIYTDPPSLKDISSPCAIQIHGQIWAIAVTIDEHIHINLCDERKAIVKIAPFAYSQLNEIDEKLFPK